MNVGQYKLYRYILPLMNANMYMLISGDGALVIDPIKDDEALKMLDRNGVKDVTVILTHEHFDHISGVNAIRELIGRAGGVCAVYANDYCANAVNDPDSNLSRFFEAMFITRIDEERKLAEKIFDKDYSCTADISFDGDMKLIWEDLTLKMKSTPGHSPGSICIEIYDNSGAIAALATGDSLVEGNLVITRLPKGSKSDYQNITRPYLEGFDPDTPILPGHGEVSLMKDLKLG